MGFPGTNNLLFASFLRGLCDFCDLRGLRGLRIYVRVAVLRFGELLGWHSRGPGVAIPGARIWRNTRKSMIWGS